MIEPIKFDIVADIYDYYVQADFDLEFFLNEANKTNGKVLELTSGTGRVSVPLLKAGIDLTCVDYSEQMLAVLEKKVRENGLVCAIHKMDIAELSLRRKYDLFLIPFNSLSEITDREKHRQTLTGVAEHLTDTGVFICTMHNPGKRLKTVDRLVRQMGDYRIEGEGRLIIQYVFNYDQDSQIVSGNQFYEIYDQHHKLIEKRILDVNFYLFHKAEFETLIKQCGFAVIDLYGDYHYSPFEEANSPYLIWKLKKKS